MAEFVIGPLVSMVKEKASSYLLDKYRVMEGMKEQRKILERKLQVILYIIQDAEEKGAFRTDVKAWLKDLKIACYEANGVFDELKYEALRREAEKKGHHRIKALASFPTRNPIVFHYRMGKKLCKIVQTIEVLVTEMNTFGFRHLQQAPPSKQWRMTDPVMVDSDKDIISRSRQEEKKKIMSILLEEASSKDLTVLPIVGMGGMGKTTFVQLIYNDPSIEEHFELRRWCCVSDDFDTANIASNICQINVNDNKGREKVLQDLQSLVGGRKYLIVLDDVWNRDDDKWGKLKSCFKHGGKGSVVLTTTRDEEIARRMVTGVAKVHNIEKLGKEHLKKIVESRAFCLQKPNHMKLDGIVEEIVERCSGSPLAAKAFGSMLSTKTSINEWKHILDKSNICNEKTDILPILKLSFDDLSSHMKQCFAFCAIFPKDYEIDKELLIQLWMAHDLIPVQDGDHLETVGEEIFRELTWRSFFQDVEEKFPVDIHKERLEFGANRTICKIHDLMHDIALSVMGKECVTAADDLSIIKLTSGHPTHHAHHAFFTQPHWIFSTFMDDFLKKQSPTLQTLFMSFRYLPNISKCTSLRVLHLPGTSLKYEDGLKYLQHLKYLNLSDNWRLKGLPKDICMLYHLQTLDLTNCKNLRQLPEDLKYMASLRHLYTKGCKSLTCMPLGIGHITSLQTITNFVVGAGSRCSTVGEIQSLNLGGELELSCLENATEVHAKEVSLENKEKLTYLSLEWTDKVQEDLVQVCHEKVLCALKPHDGLQTLRIVNYKGTSLPSWISDLSLLTELHLLGCVLCEEFPHFNHFEHIQILSLEKLEKLRSLCSDMASVTFLALKELKLHDLRSLERWVAVEGKEVKFPVLEKLHIKNCPKLTGLPGAPNLKDIKLDEGKAVLSLELLIKSRHSMASLSTLELAISDTEEVALPQINQNHESLSLSELKLKGYQFFFSSKNLSQPMKFGAWKWFEKLVTLEISCCDTLLYWPEDVFQCLLLLKNLTIESCKKLMGRTPVRGGEPRKTVDQVLPHLNKIEIGFCESLEELFIFPPSLRSIILTDCPRLESIWGHHEEHHETDVIKPEYFSSTSVPEQSASPTNRYPCLENLWIFNCENLAILPNLPPSLKSINIERCRKLCTMSGHLDALKVLDITYCSKLQSLDSLGDLPSLERIFLISCQCLASLPGVTGSYSALRELTVKYCPAIDMKLLYRRHQQRLDSLQYKGISHAYSSNPCEGPQLREPRSWKYVIPRVSDWTYQRHNPE